MGGTRVAINGGAGVEDGDLDAQVAGEHGAQEQPRGAGTYYDDLMARSGFVVGVSVGGEGAYMADLGHGDARGPSIWDGLCWGLDL